MMCAAVQERPTWIGELRSLQVVNLDFNRIRQLHQSLWTLTGLVELFISGDSLEECLTRNWTFDADPVPLSAY